MMRAPDHAPKTTHGVQCSQCLPCAVCRAQEANKSKVPELRDGLKNLNATFPAQMVAATDPKYEEKLLSKIQ